MNLKLSKICADNVQLRTEIKRMLDKRRKMTDEYNRLSMVMQNATDESRRLTSECSESFANRYDGFFAKKETALTSDFLQTKFSCTHASCA